MVEVNKTILDLVYKMKIKDSSEIILQPVRGSLLKELELLTECVKN